jgi:hypothetical protein
MRLRVNGELEFAIVDGQASSRRNPKPAPVLDERKVRTVWLARAELFAVCSLPSIICRGWNSHPTARRVEE